MYLNKNNIFKESERDTSKNIDLDHKQIKYMFTVKH